MSYTLIITEKPSAAKTIAKALANGEVKEFEKNGARWYEIKRGKKNIKVAPAAGHLFMLKQRAKGFRYTETTKEKDKSGQLVTTKVVRKLMPPDTPAISLFLRNRDPKRWPDKRGHELSGPDGGLFRLLG